jgi:hypothetical protein
MKIEQFFLYLKVILSTQHSVFVLLFTHYLIIIYQIIYLFTSLKPKQGRSQLLRLIFQKYFYGINSMLYLD